MLLKSILTSLLLSTSLFSSEVQVISKNMFFFKKELIKLDYPFIVVSFKPYKKGFAYFVNEDSISIKTLASGGAKGHETPFGMFKINYKKKYHMSTLYPALDGINNMDNMMNITSDGIALHKGSVEHLSHGCIHIEPNKSRELFNLAKKGMRVIVTSDPYFRFLE